VPNGAKHIANQNVARQPKYISSFFFIRWASSKLRDFHGSFRTKQQHFTMSNAPAIAFSLL